jgi:hypothetical protein
MAKGNGNPLLQNISGHIGKEIVIKQYGNRTVITRYPHMRKRKPTALKNIYEGRFKEAIKYARSILCNKKLKQQYQAKIGPGKRVYNQAISEYLIAEKIKGRNKQ